MEAYLHITNGWPLDTRLSNFMGSRGHASPRGFPTISLLSLLNRGIYNHRPAPCCILQRLDSGVQRTRYWLCRGRGVQPSGRGMGAGMAGAPGGRRGNLVLSRGQLVRRTACRNFCISMKWRRIEVPAERRRRGSKSPAHPATSRSPVDGSGTVAA